MPEKKYQDRGVLEKLGIQSDSTVAFANAVRDIDPDLPNALSNERAALLQQKTKLLIS